MSETKFISEAEYLRFKDKLRNIVIMMVVGFVIGLVLGIATGGGALMGIILGIMFAGMPYAWSVIPVWAIGWISIVIKLLASIFLGWIVTPIALIYNLLQMKRYEKAVQDHVIVEQTEKAESVNRENANTAKIVDAIQNQ